jgi:hypothetical protein
LSRGLDEGFATIMAFNSSDAGDDDDHDDFSLFSQLPSRV